MLTNPGVPCGAWAASQQWRDILQLPNKNIRDLASVIACPRLLETSVELPLVSDDVFGAEGGPWEDSLHWLRSLDSKEVDAWFATKRRTRLGYHFADCVEYLLRFSPAFHPPGLHVSQQVFQRQVRDVTLAQANDITLDRAPDIASGRRGAPFLPDESVRARKAGRIFTPGGKDGLSAGENGEPIKEEECVDTGNLFGSPNEGLDGALRGSYSHTRRTENGGLGAQSGGEDNSEDDWKGVGVSDSYAESASRDEDVETGQEKRLFGFGRRLAEAEMAVTRDMGLGENETEPGQGAARADGCKRNEEGAEPGERSGNVLPAGRRKSKRQQRKATKQTGKTITVGEFDILFLQGAARVSRQELGTVSTGASQDVTLDDVRPLKGSPGHLEGSPGRLRAGDAGAGVVGVEHWELSVKFLLYVGPEAKLFENGGRLGSRRSVDKKGGQPSCDAESQGFGAVKAAKEDGTRLATGGKCGGDLNRERAGCAEGDVSAERADVSSDGADVSKNAARSEEEDLLYYFVGPHAGERLSDRRDRIAKQLRLSNEPEAKLVLADLFLGVSEANGGASATHGGAAETNGRASESNGGAVKTNSGASKLYGGASRLNGRAYGVESPASRADGGASGLDGCSKVDDCSKAFRSTGRASECNGRASASDGRASALNSQTSEMDNSLLGDIDTSVGELNVSESWENACVRAAEGLRKGARSRPSSVSADVPCSEAVSGTREADVATRPEDEASRRGSAPVAVTPRAFVKGYLFYEHALWKRLVGRGSLEPNLEDSDVVGKTTDDSKPSDSPNRACSDFPRAHFDTVEGAERSGVTSSEAAGRVLPSAAVRGSANGGLSGSDGATSAPASILVEAKGDTSASTSGDSGVGSEADFVTGGGVPGDNDRVAERAELNPGHWVGWWTRDVRKFLGDPSFRESRWYIIPKMEWLSPVVIRPSAEHLFEDSPADQTPREKPSASGRPPLSNRCTSTALTSEELAAAKRQINGQDASFDGSALPLESSPDAPVASGSARPGFDTVSPVGDLDALRAIGAVSGEPTAGPTNVESASRLLSSAEFLLQIETLQAVAERCKVPRRGRVLVAELRWEGVASEEGSDVSIRGTDGAWREVSRGFVVESTWPMTGELPIMFP
ncbi:hypothetical protein KFL_000520180 [Klebsormidium nitens]|uniref:Uncharacterized protein n=1 Tax=Klebsormidium nitens TaxID=105231 RepID=A0A1Y1HUY2_KLENI|nr:hypothetical protein KFL_000520180 [Klebsormidium nitens]|eukprot:GAQ80347.1 hypothetical protein KFL_000520180 [Klebsormidium nitens]